MLAAGEMGFANNIGIYSDGRYSYQLTIYIFRYGEGTVMAIMHPDNPVAQKSVTRYMAGDEVGVRAGSRTPGTGDASRSVGQTAGHCHPADRPAAGDCRGASGGAEGDMRRLADFVVRWPWVVIGVWVALAIALPLTFPSLSEMAQKHPLAILPSDARRASPRERWPRRFRNRATTTSCWWR